MLALPDNTDSSARPADGEAFEWVLDSPEFSQSAWEVVEPVAQALVSLRSGQIEDSLSRLSEWDGKLVALRDGPTRELIEDLEADAWEVAKSELIDPDHVWRVRSRELLACIQRPPETDAFDCVASVAARMLLEITRTIVRIERLSASDMLSTLYATEGVSADLERCSGLRKPQDLSVRPSFVALPMEAFLK